MKKDAVLNRGITYNPGDILFIQVPKKYRMDGISLYLKVTGVSERYGVCPLRKRVQNHIVKGIDLETGEKESFDFSFVSKVISRSKVEHPPTNRLSHFYEKDLLEGSTQGTISGGLMKLIMFELGKLPVKIDRWLHKERCMELFDKTKPGLVEIHEYGYLHTVRKKPFRNWLKKNYHRLMMTVAEVQALETLELEKDLEELEAAEELFEKVWG